MERVVNKCLSCGNKMRAWNTTDPEAPNHIKYVTMCVTDGCVEQGIVYRVLEYSVKVEVSIKI